MIIFSAPSFAMHKPQILLVCAITAGGCLLEVGRQLKGRERNTAFSARHVRLSVLQTRSGSEASSVGVKSFALMRDGCALTSPARPLTWGTPGGGAGAGAGDAYGASVFLSFAEEPVVANGWSLTTSEEAGSEGLDPMYFVIHVSQGLSEAEVAQMTLRHCIVAQVYIERERDGG